MSHYIEWAIGEVTKQLYLFLILKYMFLTVADLVNKSIKSFIYKNVLLSKNSEASCVYLYSRISFWILSVIKGQTSN